VDRKDLISELAATDPDDQESVAVLVADLKKLRAEDLPEGIRVSPCSRIDGSTISPIIDDGVLMRGTDTPLVALIERSTYRKFGACQVV
jgi:hypothetical protein